MAIGAEPKIEVEFSHFETNSEMRIAIVKFRNVGNSMARFRGYDSKTPAYELEKWTPKGLNLPIMRCGTGLRNQFLYPGREVSAEVYVRGPGDWRAGLHYSQAHLIERLPLKIQAHLDWLPRPQPGWRTAWGTWMACFATEED